MRKLFSVILVSIAFLTIQGGRVANYLLCKWQAEVVLEQVNCDCNKHLVADAQNDASHTGTVHLKITTPDHLNTSFVFSFRNIDNNGIDHLDAISSLTAEGFPSSCFHPPSIV